MTCPGGNCFVGIRTRRQAQQYRKVVKKFKPCLLLGKMNADADEALFYIKQGNCKHEDYWDLSCQMTNRQENCYYYVTCTNNKQPLPVLNPDWTCTSVHKFEKNPQCCDFVCP